MNGFDPEAKEAELQAEASTWDTSSPVPAQSGDIPVIDASGWLGSDDPEALRQAANTLREASEQVGFYQLVGHDVDQSLIDEMFEMTERFHALPLDVKQQIEMDQSGTPIGGIGYLPIGERKLPRRTYGNLNEAFIIKNDRNIDYHDNLWLTDEALPGFRATVERYGRAVESLALRLLPLYATALDLESSYFAKAFEHPFWRLRMSHYPADPPGPDDAFGIAPHVDTTVFTLLLQSGPGLTIYHAGKDQWIEAPVIPNAFVVNAGELLRQWTNDRFLSARHFANNLSIMSSSRMSPLTCT